MPDAKDPRLAAFELHLATAEKVSDRRAQANTWTLSVNSAIVALYGYLQTDTSSARAPAANQRASCASRCSATRASPPGTRVAASGVSRSARLKARSQDHALHSAFKSGVPLPSQTSRKRASILSVSAPSPFCFSASAKP